MFNHRLEQKVSRIVVVHWFLLSFNGGAINAGGFLATGRFVSHVTGFATLFGVDATRASISTAVGILSVPLFFLLGAFTAGILIDRPVHLGKRPHFDWVMGISAVCLLFASGGSQIFNFGIFGEQIHLHQAYLLLVLLCLASGLQNAAITSSSGKSVRTTHLTGLTTDLGLGLARIVSFGYSGAQKDAELRANYLRIGSIASFILGSAFGAYIFLKLEYVGFLIPAAISAYAAVQGRNASGSERSY